MRLGEEQSCILRRSVATDENTGATCVHGAAKEILFGDPHSVQDTYTVYKVMDIKQVRCPECGEFCTMPYVDGAMARVLTHLNDYHKWTRERIADWLEPIELEFERANA